jgi:pentose-5-phosphate-3-epimerase
VDGGVQAKTIRAMAEAGATHAVVGSAVFNTHATVNENLKALRAMIRQGVPGIRKSR